MNTLPADSSRFVHIWSGYWLIGCDILSRYQRRNISMDLVCLSDRDDFSFTFYAFSVARLWGCVVCLIGAWVCDVLRLIRNGY